MKKYLTPECRVRRCDHDGPIPLAWMRRNALRLLRPTADWDERQAKKKRSSARRAAMRPSSLALIGMPRPGGTVDCLLIGVPGSMTYQWNGNSQTDERGGDTCGD